MNKEAFTNRARAYTEARPGYAEEAVEYILSLVSKDAVFADIGAGTGKFTEQIARRGYKIFAVEPNADMRGELVKNLAPYPDVSVIDGSAEASSLADSCADVITNAQALRRFDIGLFRAECIRIGKNPLVVTVFNEGDRISVSKKNMDGVSEGYAKATGSLYKNPEIRKFPNPAFFTREKWHMYYSSMEGVPLVGEPGYEEHTAELNKVFDRDIADGVLRQELVTFIYSERF